MKPDDTPEPWRDDPIVAEVRAARERLLAEAGGDLDVLFARLKAREAARGRQLVAPPPPHHESDVDAA